MTRLHSRTQAVAVDSKPVLMGALTAGALTLGLMAANPAEAQNYRYDRNNDRDRSSSTEDVLIGAAVGAIAGAIIGQGEGEYVLGGAIAGAAIGATSGNDNDCGYYRNGRCYRNQGHWEREHGINSRDPRYAYGQDRRDYRYDRRYERRDDRRDRRYDRRDERRDYRYDRRW